MTTDQGLHTNKDFRLLWFCAWLKSGWSLCSHSGNLHDKEVCCPLGETVLAANDELLHFPSQTRAHPAWHPVCSQPSHSHTFSSDESEIVVAQMGHILSTLFIFLTSHLWTMNPAHWTIYGVMHYIGYLSQDLTSCSPLTLMKALHRPVWKFNKS